MTKRKRKPNRQQLLDQLVGLVESGEVKRERVLTYLRKKTQSHARGLPPLDKRTRESFLLGVRVTGQQRVFLQLMAKRQEMTVSAYLRRFVEEAIDGVTKLEEFRQELMQLQESGGAAPQSTEANTQGGDNEQETRGSIAGS